jgi:sortase A
VHAADSVALDTSNWDWVPAPDQSDWSSKRVAAYTRSLQLQLDAPMAVVSIPTIDIAVRVYADDVPMALESGTAWVAGSAAPATRGNIVVAGHRDGFFRRLEGIPLGTQIQLTTDAGIQEFEVVNVSIVDALDMSPLEPTDETVLTLITCHPFRYQGFAPDRYIVRAQAIANHSTTSRIGQFDSIATSGQPK